MSDVFDRARNTAGAIKRGRRLRTIMTYPERLLWEALRRQRLPIRRQVPIGRYVADFACHSASLVVEVDGYSHGLPEVQRRDAVRDAWLKSQGYRVLRFPNQQVVDNLNSVIESIQKALPPRWGKGRDGGVSQRLPDGSQKAGTPLSSALNPQRHTPTQPSPIEGEGEPHSEMWRPYEDTTDSDLAAAGEG